MKSSLFSSVFPSSCLHTPRRALHLIGTLMVLAAVVGVASEAKAARPGKNQLTMSLQGPEVRATVTPPAAEFPFADDNGDGLINLTELRGHRAQIESRFSEAFQTVSAEGSVPANTYLGVHLPRDAGEEGADHLRFIVRRVFDRQPSRLDVSYQLFEHVTEPVTAWIVGSSGKVDAVLSPTQKAFSYEPAQPVSPQPRAEERTVVPVAAAPANEAPAWTTLHTGLLVVLLALLLGLGFLAYDARLWPFNLWVEDE